MENKFSVNQEQLVEGVSVPRLYLDELDKYKTVVTGLRLELGDLVSDNYMTEAVAERVINEFMYTAFTGIVKINLR